MYAVSQAFRTALESGAVQKIRGVIYDVGAGELFQLSDDNISKPQFTRQCTTNTDSFGFGQLYASTVSLKILGVDELMRTDLRGGKLRLGFSVEGSSEWVPLGVWNITEPQRDSQNSITINGVDNTAKLDAPIPYKENNMSSFSRRMETITELTGVEFKQTAQEIFAIAGIARNPNGVWAQGFCNTCREELIAMAQYTGLLVYIDRDGEIVFRKFGDAQLPSAIQASRRHKADLAEYTMCVAALAYTCGGRYRDTAVFYADDITHANTDLCLYFADNPYMKLGKAEDAEDYVKIAVNNLADCGIWVPGTFDFYGDPTIDLGDLVTVSGGINGDTSTAFLVTGIVWQFRGPMTLISAGAAEAVSNYGGSSGSGGSSSGGGGGQTVVQKPWEMVDLESFPQALTSRWREIGAALFAVADETLVIAHVNANFTGSDIGEVVVHVLMDGVMQTEYSLDTIAGSQKLTTEKNVPLLVESGVHRLTIEAKGAATVDRIVASVYGQGVSEYTGEPTFESEYRYHADTVDKYIGSSLTPRIPAQLGGNDIHVLGGGSFAESEVEYVYIPQGTEEIK